MSDPTNPADKKLFPGYVPVPNAPLVYFDIVPSHGVFAGSIQIELAARTLVPLAKGGVEAQMVEVGRLRCTPAAAKFLIDNLEAALKMLEQPQGRPMAASKFN